MRFGVKMVCNQTCKWSNLPVSWREPWAFHFLALDLSQHLSLIETTLLIPGEFKLDRGQINQCQTTKPCQKRHGTQESPADHKHSAKQSKNSLLKLFIWKKDGQGGACCKKGNENTALSCLPLHSSEVVLNFQVLQAYFIKLSFRYWCALLNL